MAASGYTGELQDCLPLVARGKVRDLYEIDKNTLLFVASDRISAYDVNMGNASLLFNLVLRVVLPANFSHVSSPSRTRVSC